MTENFEEENVDENLTDYLKEPIKTQKRSYTEAFEEQVDDEEEEDDKNDMRSATHKTKDEIYRIWTSVCNEKSEELLPLVEKLSRLTESQALAYLACLKAVNSQTVHKHLSLRLLIFLSRGLCHPDDAVTPLAMEQDPFLINGISLLVSDILTAVGRLALPLLLSAYAGTSWYWFRTKAIEEKKTSGSRTTRVAEAAIQNDGVCPVTNGQDIANDKANDEGMDSRL